MKAFPLHLITLALITFLGACGPDEAPLSDAEKDQRQDLALDISGQYVAEQEGEHPSVVTIENENDTHDIRVEFSLGRNLNASEQKQVELALKADDKRMTAQELEMILADLDSQLQTVVLGEGKTYDFRGGENVALDAEGNQSEVVVNSRDSEFYEARFENAVESYRLKVDFYFTAHKAEQTLDYRMTRNTDTDGSTSDDRKGMMVSIWKESKDSSGHHLRTSSICTLNLTMPTFQKIKN